MGAAHKFAQKAPFFPLFYRTRLKFKKVAGTLIVIFLIISNRSHPRLYPQTLITTPPLTPPTVPPTDQGQVGEVQHWSQCGCVADQELEGLPRTQTWHSWEHAPRHTSRHTPYQADSQKWR